MPLTHRGFGAFISCDGRELEQFQVKVESDKIVSCYVPGDTGTDYKVHWVESNPPTHLSVEVRTDGRRIGVVSHIKGSSKTTHPGLPLPLDGKCSDTFLHVADVGDALPSAYGEEIGSIEVRLRRVRDFVAVSQLPSRNAAGPSRGRGRPSTGSVHVSTASRGNTNSASARSRKENQPKPTVLRPILVDDKPYVIFRFLYRPSEVLEANGIKPSGRRQPQSSTSSSVSSSSKRRKRVSGKETSTSAAQDYEQPPGKKRRVSPERSVEPEPSTSEDRRSDDEMYLDVGPTFDEQKNMPAQDHDPEDAKLFERDGILDAPQSSPPTQPSTDTTALDADIEEEMLVEVHLSARNGFVPPPRDSPVLREPSLPLVKRESSPDAPVPISSRSELPDEEDVKPKIEECEVEQPEESVVEVHLNSRNQHIVFGTNPDRRVKEEAVKKEEYPEPPRLSGEPGPPVVKFEEEETVVEVHISSKDIRNALDRRTDGESAKAEPTE